MGDNVDIVDPVNTARYGLVLMVRHGVPPAVTVAGVKRREDLP